MANKYLPHQARAFALSLLLLAGVICLDSGKSLAAQGVRQSPAPSTVYGGAPMLPPGAVTVTPYGSLRESDELDDYDVADLGSIADPFEPWNRFWFHFNDIFYLYVARPAYDAWVFITPHQIRGGLKNFFSNLLFPVRFVNNILQFRFMEAGVEFGRFVINTTSSLGLADVAKGKKAIVAVDPTGEDFGQTLGRWGIGQGFYLVWPIIGPSSARDTVGRVGDLFADPLFYLQPWELGAGVSGGLRFNALGDVLPLYEDLNSVALDPYIAMREAYVNFRKSQVMH